MSLPFSYLYIMIEFSVVHHVMTLHSPEVSATVIQLKPDQYSNFNFKNVHQKSYPIPGYRIVLIHTFGDGDMKLLADYFLQEKINKNLTFYKRYKI